MKKTKENLEAKEAENLAKENKSSKKTVAKVGSLLKEMRLENGMRLPDVSKKLCIRKLYLEAIEESNYDEIPAFPYGIGFIRSYAEYLGLNGDNIVELYKEETNVSADKDIYVLEPQSEANVPSRKYLLISLVAIALIYAGWSFYTNQNDSEELPADEELSTDVAKSADDAGNNNNSIVVEYAASASDMETTENVEDVAVSDGVNQQVYVTEESFVDDEPKTEDKLDNAEIAKPQNEVVIKVIEETWVEVKDDSKLYLSKVLNPGTEYVVPGGGKGMILSIGKVDGAEVYINGKLTKVARANKKTNIALDPFLSTTH